MLLIGVLVIRTIQTTGKWRQHIQVVSGDTALLEMVAPDADGGAELLYHLPRLFLRQAKSCGMAERIGKRCFPSVLADGHGERIGLLFKDRAEKDGFPYSKRNVQSLAKKSV
jgi:hypothetical protein